MLMITTSQTIAKLERDGFITSDDYHRLARSTNIDANNVSLSLKRVSLRICNVSSGGIKYSAYDLFGLVLSDSKVYYYHPSSTGRIVKFLVILLYRKHLLPDQHIRHVFTQFMHNHGLHWNGCLHIRMPQYACTISG